jgi:DNA-directed RNA polymerase specialized sigma24 family protein
MSVGTQPAAEPVALANLSDKDLIQRHCQNRKDKNVADELWRRCGEKLHQSLRHLVFRRNGLCPDCCDRALFLDSTVSRLYFNFFARICTFEALDSPRSLKGWLDSVARTAALDEYRDITRSRAPIVETGLGEVFPEEAGGDSGELSVLEAGKRLFRSKLFRYYGRAQKIAPPDAGIKTEERKFVVRELLIRYSVVSDENAHSARLIRLRYFREWEIIKIVEYVYGEPASTRQEETWKRYVYREMAHDYENLRPLLASEFGIRELWQV